MAGGAGDDQLVGGDGNDVAVFAGNAADYNIDLVNSQVVDANTGDGNEGTDTLAVSKACSLATVPSDSIDGRRFGSSGEYPCAGTAGYSSIAGLEDGGYIVTWTDESGQDGSGYGIYGQRYGASGSPFGEEFQINTHTNSTQTYPSVEALANGGYVVTWQSYSEHDGGQYDIAGQMFSASGEAVGDEFRINSTTYHYQYEPSVASLSDGGFVVTWWSYQQDGYYDVYGQRYDTNGESVGEEFRANVDRMSYDQEKPSVAGLENGEFVVTWQDETTSSRSSQLDHIPSSELDNSGWAVFGQKFKTVDANGIRLYTGPGCGREPVPGQYLDIKHPGQPIGHRS